MKNLIVLSLTIVLFLGMNAFQDHPHSLLKEVLSDQEAGFHVPDQIQAILDNKCLQCHGTDGNGKAKMKWNYSKMGEMQTSKLVSKLAKIIDKVDDQKMPPKSYLKKHPEKKLTEGEKQNLTEWAEKLAEELVMN